MQMGKQMLNQDPASRGSSDRPHRDYTILFAWVFLLFIMSFVFLMALIEYHDAAHDGKIIISYSAEDLKGSDYQEVEKRLSEEGFTNISLLPHKDLITGWVNKAGEVEKVEIEGDSEFDGKDRFKPDAKIIIIYHTF